MDVRDGYKLTEVGIVPEDWVVTSIGDFAGGDENIVDGPFGSNLKVSDYTPTGVPVLQGQNITGDRFEWKEIRFISEDKGKELRRSNARIGDLLTVKIGSVGFSAIVSTLEGYSYAIIPANLIRVRFTSAKTCPLFAYFALTAQDGKQRLRDLAGNTAQPALGLGGFRSFLLPAPPTRTEQEAIVEALSDVAAQIKSLEDLLAKKSQIKQGAMQQLLSGNRRLPGFSEEWQVKPFDLVLERLNAKAHQIQALDYRETGSYPVVDQGKARVAGFSDEVGKLFRCPKSGVIIFGDHTCIVKFIDFDFLVGADGSQVLRAKAGQLTRFHAFQLQVQGIVPTGYNRHFRYLKELRFLAPPLPEQEAIATVLSDMEAEIAALETKLAKTRLLKQGMMQELLTGRIRLV